MKIDLIDTTQQPAEPAPTPEPQPSTPPPDPTVRVQRAKDLYKTMWQEEPPADAPGGGTAVPPTQENPTGSPAAVPAQPPSPPEPTATPPATTPSAEDLISRTARETGQAIANAMRPQPPQGQPVPQPEPALRLDELAPEDLKDLQVVQYLERTNAAWSGKTAAFMRYLNELYAYQDKWGKENPGREWNLEDSEHSQFIADHRPDIDPEALDEARIEMKAEEVYRRKHEPELKKMRGERALAEAMPKIGKTVLGKIVKLVELVNPNLVQYVRDPQGNPALTKENVDALDAADPTAKAVINRMVTGRLEPMLFELEKTAVKDLDYRLNPWSNPCHRAIREYQVMMEQEIVSKGQVIKNGKQFLTVEQFNAKIGDLEKAPLAQSEIDRKISELNALYWTLTIDDVEDRIVGEIAKEAKDQIAEIDGIGERKWGRGAGNVPRNAPNTRNPMAQPVPVPSPAATGGKPRPPAITTQSDVVTTSTPNIQGDKKFSEVATQTLFG